MCILLEFYICEQKNILTKRKATKIYSQIDFCNVKLSPEQIDEEIFQLKLLTKYLSGKIDLNFKNFPRLKYIAEKIVFNCDFKQKLPQEILFEHIHRCTKEKIFLNTSRLCALMMAYERRKGIKNNLFFQDAIEIFQQTKSCDGHNFSDQEVGEGAYLLIAICDYLKYNFKSLAKINNELISQKQIIHPEAPCSYFNENICKPQFFSLYALTQ